MATISMSVTWSVSPLTSPKLRRVNRYSRMAFASGNKESPCLGVKVTEGLGNLPKVVLTSPGSDKETASTARVCALDKSRLVNLTGKGPRGGECLPIASFPPLGGSFKSALLGAMVCHKTQIEAELYLFGACITSWKVGNKDLLFVRPDAVFNGQKPISGGIPHCFPQFGPGQIQQHGFARNVDWSLVNSENVEGNPVITVELKDGPYSRSMWDYSFQALYKVTLDEKTLSTEFRVTNTDQKPFSFTTALHTYFRGSIGSVSVRGLKGCKTLNKHPDPKNPVEGNEGRDVVTFPGFVDCVYLDAPNELQLDNGLGDTISIKNTNWSDAVLWNPHLTMEACYKDFVCVENAKIGQVELEPNQSWTAVQHLSVP